MSSPYVPSREDFPDRRVASSPVSSTDHQPDTHGDSLRPMRLKVLYTFDDQNKTNCLARWPRVLNIRTALLDETTHIGVIELKICIQAIVAASPELVAKLGQDYTVYAYDYSELDTPLVGQGMLSWVLASASSTPSAPAHQSRTVVTGRVCKNILGLFANGVQETLEVKLRLVPVPTCLQSEYIESMKKYRELSRIMPEEFDAQAWTDFLKANPGILSLGGSGSQSPTTNPSQPNVGIEHVQRLLSNGYESHGVKGQPFHMRRDSYASSAAGTDIFRGGSPTPSMQSVATQSAPPPLSRSASRLSSNESQLHTRRVSSASIEGGFVSNDERMDEGPAKKRAKIMKTSFAGKSSFGKKADSLRVAASTAASVRVLQPTAVRPSSNPVNSLEVPPRAPTPIPQSTKQRHRPLLPATKSSLGRESLTGTEMSYQSPYQFPEGPSQAPESAMTSPETALIGSSGNSPQEPNSSPPVVRDISIAPSSPVLPALPQHEDSGFMSGHLDELFEDLNDDEERPIDADDVVMAAQYSIRPELAASQVADKPAPPPTVTPSEPQQRQEADPETQMRSKEITRHAAGLKRSQTWSGDQPGSDPPVAPAPRPQAPRRDSEASQPKYRTGWDKEKRKQIILKKLDNSIAAGEVPPFCENCGDIETPTWRKAFAKIHSGTAEKAVISDEEGGIIAVEILETNEDGSTKLFRIIKKTLLKSDEGFSAILLCNPCGIWLALKKSMRPESKWYSSLNKKGFSKSRAKRLKKPRKGEDRHSDIENIKSEAITPDFDMSWAPDSPNLTTDNSPEHENPEEPELPPMVQTRTHGIQGEITNNEKPKEPMDPSAIEALQRAIQSSPAHFLGSEQSPIELDGCSPEPVRRTLFPSPKTGGPLGINTNERVSPSQKLPKTHNETLHEQLDGDEQADKENLPPRPTTPNAFDEFLSDFAPVTPSRGRETIPSNIMADLFKTPTKSTSNKLSPSNTLADLFKTPNKQSPSHIFTDLFKTPTKTSPSKHSLSTGDFFSSAAKAFLNPQRTPSRSPSKATPKPTGDMTPFGRQLNQMLSDMNAPETPSRLLSDIGTLPPLSEAATPSRLFRTSDFDFCEFESSDGPMPSSPPNSNWFNVYQDPGEAAQWADLGLGSSPLKSTGVSPKSRDEIEGGPSLDGGEDEQMEEVVVQTATAVVA